VEGQQGFAKHTEIHSPASHNFTLNLLLPKTCMASSSKILFEGVAWIKKEKYKKNSRASIMSLAPLMAWKKRNVTFHDSGKLVVTEGTKVKSVHELDSGSSIVVSEDGGKDGSRCLQLKYKNACSAICELVFFPGSTTTVEDEAEEEEKVQEGVVRRMSVGASSTLETWHKWLSAVINQKTVDGSILNVLNDDAKSVESLLKKKSLSRDEAARIKQVMMMDKSGHGVLAFTGGEGGDGDLEGAMTLGEILKDCERLEKQIAKEIVEELYGGGGGDKGKVGEEAAVNRDRVAESTAAVASEALILKMMGQKTLTVDEQELARELMVKASGLDEKNREGAGGQLLELGEARERSAGGDEIRGTELAELSLESKLDLLVFSGTGVGAEIIGLPEAGRKGKGKVKVKGKVKGKEARTGGGMVEAEHDFQASEGWHSALFAGEKVFVLEEFDDGWILVRKEDGSEGCVPANYLLAPR